ncbi:hypothetical protein [Melittangium boletus]|uniref:Uncharacterized protein n=1 Tax=Melittangium boletus DSM 14713 TaxID=1294270 RepID=A0A250IT71_9BACT|nr:hypothetical protein [Melittangium boletus]ATB34136.1 hypothetical protein MEBOL_007637 [Melittangium boletus DSM 14713]
MKKLLVFVVLLAVGAGAAYHFGYLDRLGLGGLRVRLIPKDPALLAYFGPDTRELLLVNSTELNVPLSKEAQEKFEREVKDFHAKTGVDTAKDVDAFAAAMGFGVARGRFDWGRLSAYLQSEGYTLTELEGAPAAVKPRAADVALDGHYLLVGPQGVLEEAISRKRRGEGLGKDSPLVKAVDEVGWKHGMVGGVVSGSRLSDFMGGVDKQVLSLLGALDLTAEGLELQGTAVTGGKRQGEALRAMLEGLRMTALLGSSLDSSGESRALRESLEKATLETDEQGRVRGTIRFPFALVDAASLNYSRASLADQLQGLSTSSEDEAPSRSGQPPAASRPPAPVTVDWKPPVLGLVLLVIALVTMGARTRPGMFNVLFHPLFLLPFLVATMGVFVFRWTGHAGGAFDVLALPLPEWHRFVAFPEARTVALSAAVPLVFAILSVPASWLRRFAAGLGVGFSAYLAVRALASPPLPLIPPAYTLYWYVGNALAALLLARLTIPPRQGKQGK